MGNGAMARESRITPRHVITALERGVASNQDARPPRRGPVRPLVHAARGLPDAHSPRRRWVEVHSEAVGTCAG